MTRKIFVDTNVIKAFSNGTDTVLVDLIELAEKDKVELYINSIVIEQFFSESDLDSKDNYNKSFMFFNQFFTCIEIGSVEGLKAGELIRKNLLTNSNNAIIASTCICNNLELISINSNQYENIPDLKLFNIEK